MMRKRRGSSVDIGEKQAPSSTKAKKSRTIGRQSEVSAPEEPAESVFSTFVREAGVTLSHGSASNEIAVDQVVFQKRIKQKLQKSPRYPGIVQEFISGLESHIEDADRFRNCLLPCVPRMPDGDFRCVSSFQESLLRMLLGIEMLQTLIINTLLEKLPEYMLNSADDAGLSIPRIIINQLKWLDRVVESKELAVKLMELLSVAPVDIQRDIINSLPEILEDSQHNDIARELNSLLKENTQLTVAILDALSSLNLSSSLLTEVRGAVMNTLAAVQLEDLPVVVKFILHSISTSNAYEVVCGLRKKLELEQCVLPPVMQASQNRLSKGSAAFNLTTATTGSQDFITLIVDAIKSAVRFQKTISEAWLKAIESVEEVEEHKVIDLLVLFILHSTNANQSRRGAEKLLKMKVRTGLISEALLQKTFKDNKQVLRGYFSSILALAQSLLRSPDPCVVPFAGHMYRHSFTSFDTYCQQEVVGSLVTHVCSGVGVEVDMALELLCSLVTELPAEIGPYAVFVKGILDYLDNLTPQQIRRLFHLLSRLAFGPQQGSHIQDDMHIVIRKQLSSTAPKYKRIGIIGGVMIIGSMGALVPKAKATQNSSLPPETFRQLSALLELVQSSSETSPEAAALYCDELANLIQTSTLDPQVQEKISKSVLDVFQGNFVVDLGPERSGSFPFPARVMYDLDEDESQGGIAINLMPLLANDMHSRAEQHSRDKDNNSFVSRNSLCLSPFFRLLRFCEEKQNQGDLEEIDALLGCPLILTDMDVVEKIDSLSKVEREFICTLLFHTINWFREVVNAFCKIKDKEMKMKVMTRLQNITYLHSLLEKALAGTPGYVPPVANFDGETTDVIVPSTTAPVNKTKKDGSGKKRKAPGKNSSEGSSQMEDKIEEEMQQEPEKEKEKEARQGVNLASYRPFFRELDLEMLSVLQCGLKARSTLDSELNTKERQEVLLGPAELVYLLEDMLRKLEFRLTAAPAKRVPFLKARADKTMGFSHLQQKSPKDVASFCIQMLPALCSHLESCHNHFQSLLSDNDGIVDGPGTDAQEHQIISFCYQLLLQLFNSILRWSGFSQPCHRSLLKKGLGVFAGRLKDGGDELNLELLVKHSFKYLLNFRSTIPNLSSALYLSQLLTTVSEKGGNAPAYREQTASLARSFLSQSWVTVSGEKQRGTKFNEALHAVLSIYLEHVEDVLKAVEEIANEGFPQIIDAKKDESSGSWPTLSRQTFLVFYKVLMAVLEKSVRKIPSGKISDNSEAQGEKLLTWNLAVRDFHILVNLVKVFDSRPVLNVCLKYGRLFLESFLKLGMPLLDYSFKRHKEDVQSLLKTFQLSTRQLHHMCGHSKIHQDTNLTNHVPAVKKSLELFVYRVKAMLTLNNCQEAFWMGNLKNRNLKGEEILSQRSQESEEEDEEQLAPQGQFEEEEQDSDAETKRKSNREESGDDGQTDDSEIY
ncbi:Fanconi anemia group D2 protein isoform X1 [Phycodurus eques]|uniref:Fanconi anemia group D2 protein isoform X1 n=1 Tax=Phycodurus eques TaxID=693459 RepID=UPI002ACD88AE|nr:Fanconi anemia group D2 protein isoform X1 [Phycodurus eques]XP_061543455.1 Fanconi anemia group D2 protein isoform X1 [Phycodurus eques]